MSTSEQLIKARMGVLALAQELENIRLACKRQEVLWLRLVGRMGADQPIRLTRAEFRRTAHWLVRYSHTEAAYACGCCAPETKVA